MEISFLNVDLVIDSSEDLQLLVEEFAANISVMFNGKWENGLNRLSVSISDSYQKTADEIISEFCFLIEDLSAESKLIWEKSNSKNFDIGFESGSIGRHETEIRAKTVERIAKLRASILVTIYPLTD